MVDDLAQIKRELELAKRADLDTQPSREDSPDQPKPRERSKNRGDEEENDQTLHQRRRQAKKDRQKKNGKKDPREAGFMALKGVGRGPFIIGGLITGTLDLSNIFGLVSFSDSSDLSSVILNVVLVGGASTSYMITKMIIDPKKGMGQKFVANRMSRFLWPIAGEIAPLWNAFPFWSISLGLIWNDARKQTKKLGDDQAAVAGGDKEPLDDPAYADLYDVEKKAA